MTARWIQALAGGRHLFLDVSSKKFTVRVLFKKTRRRQLSEDGIRSSTPNPRFGGVWHHRWACEIVSPTNLFLMNLFGSDRSSSTFVFLRVGSFRSTVLFIGGGCCSAVLVLRGLSMMTSRLSTTTTFAWLRRERGDDGGAPSA